MASLWDRLSLRRSRERTAEDSGRDSSQDESGKVQDREASSHSAGAVFDIDLSYRGEPAQHAALSHAALLLQQGIPLELGPVPDAPSTTSPRTVEALRQLLRPGTTLEAMLLEDSIGIRSSMVMDEGKVDLVRFCTELCRVGYDARVVHNAASLERHSAGGGEGGPPAPNALEKLRHSHILVTGLTGWEQEVADHLPNDASPFPTLIIVDPLFKEQFQLGHPSRAYASLLAALPDEFVGSPDRLHAVVHLLCGEVAAAFVCQGQPLPPWRTLRSTLGKWFDLGPATQAVAAPGDASAQGAVPAAEDPAADAPPPAHCRKSSLTQELDDSRPADCDGDDEGCGSTGPSMTGSWASVGASADLAGVMSGLLTETYVGGEDVSKINDGLSLHQPEGCLRLAPRALVSEPLPENIPNPEENPEREVARHSRAPRRVRAHNCESQVTAASKQVSTVGFDERLAMENMQSAELSSRLSSGRASELSSCGPAGKDDDDDGQGLATDHKRSLLAERLEDDRSQGWERLLPAVITVRLKGKKR